MADHAPFRLRILGGLDPERLARLRARVPDVDVQLGVEGGDPPGAILAWQRDDPGIASLLQRHGEAIRWIHLRRSAMTAALLGFLDSYPGLTLTNGRGAGGPAIGEYVVAVILALYKRLPELRDRQHRAAWHPYFHVAELRGRTVCIVGLGDLGRSAAKLLRPFGVRLLGVRRHPEPVPEVDETHTPDALWSLLPRTDILIVAAPFTPDTRTLIGAAELARLPRGAYLVNIARGPLLDEAALADALRSGHLAGAALDVFIQEPLPPDSPLWSIPTLIITPHTSTHSPETDDRALEIFLDNLARFRRGDALLNVVDPTLGY